MEFTGLFVILYIMKPRSFKFLEEPEFKVWDVENISLITDLVKEYIKGFIDGTYDINTTYDTEYGRLRCASFDGPINQNPYDDDIHRDISDFNGWDILTLISIPTRNIMFNYRKDLPTVEEIGMELDTPLLSEGFPEFTDDHVDDWN